MKTTYHVGKAVRDTDGTILRYDANRGEDYYMRSAVERALRTLRADLKERGIAVAADDYAVVRCCSGEPERKFDYWRKPEDGLPKKGERVLIYCELNSPFSDDLYFISIGEWTGERWRDESNPRKAAIPVKFWQHFPEAP